MKIFATLTGKESQEVKCGHERCACAAKKGARRRHRKMISHAPILKPFKCAGLRFFFCKHKLMRVFPPRQQTFFSWGLPTEEAMTRGAKVITGDTIFLAMLRLLIFSH